MVTGRESNRRGGQAGGTHACWRCALSFLPNGLLPNSPSRGYTIGYTNVLV